MILAIKSLLIVVLLTISYLSKASLPQIIEHQKVSFNLCASDRIVKGLFFDVVDVGIYYPECSEARNVFDDKTKVLRFAYLRDVDGEQFTEGAIEYLNANLTDAEKSKCVESFKAINSSYVDVSDGDVYDLFLISEQGLELYLNTKHLIDMNNIECDSAYLNVWFGEKSMDSVFSDLNKKLIEKN